MLLYRCVCRGKDDGHDIDLLLSHPEEGLEQGLLPQLLQRLDHQDLIVYGKWEKSSYSDDILKGDTKLAYLRSSLDHFEKWIGILKVDKRHRKLHAEGGARNSSDRGSEGNGQGDHDKCSDKSVTSATTNIGSDVNPLPPDSLDTASNLSNPLKRKRSLDDLNALASSSRSWLARRVDLIVTPASQYYYALVGWTGSKQFNRSLRLYAQKELNMKLTSHGLYDYSEVSMKLCMGTQGLIGSRCVEARLEGHAFTGS